MEKTKRYSLIKFKPGALRKAIGACRAVWESKKERLICSVTVGNEDWTFDDIDEFLAQYGRDDVVNAFIRINWSPEDVSQPDNVLHYAQYPRVSQVAVQSKLRASIETVFSVFEDAPPDDKIKIQSAKGDNKLVIFVGHGRRGDWRELKSHLQEQHKLNVIAYETGARAGHTIRDILDDLSKEASLALLVLTGEDETKSGRRARQNVIHECGLFQGRLGFDRVIMLVEKGIELASNLEGIQQIRFTRGRISETFGDVLATIKREFGPV